MISQANILETDQNNEAKAELATDMSTKLGDTINSLRAVLAHQKIGEVDAAMRRGVENVLHKLTAAQAACIQVKGDPANEEFVAGCSSLKEVAKECNSARKMNDLTIRLLKNL